MDWAKVTELADKTCISTFGKESTYVPAIGAPYSIDGIFQEKYQPVDPNTDTVISSQHPALFVRYADIPAEPPEGDRVTIGTRTFRIIDVQKDGAGGAVLILQKV